MNVVLRPYQDSAVKGIYRWFQNEAGSPLIVMPTGTGKAYTICEFMRSALAYYPETRILNLTHVKELIKQNYDSMINLWPEAPAGIYSAGLKSRDLDSQIIFAGIQSIYKKANLLNKIDLVIVDEAHMINRNNNSMYGKFLTALREINPKVKLIGFTATPFRLQCGLLYQGTDRLFDGIAYEYKINEAIAQGYLCEVSTKKTDTTLDVTGVKKVGGDFQEKSLQAAVDVDKTTQAIVSEIVAKGKDRGSWLLFCAGISHANNVRDAVRSHGISCETINGKTSPTDRDKILQNFKSGKIKCVTNVGVLTTGFDAPCVDLIGALRPTQSLVLWIQMLGRGMRLAEGKDDCLILDFAGNTERHGVIDQINVKDGRGSGEGDAPIKICPKCNEINFAGVSNCKRCDFKFPPNEIKLKKTSSNGALLSHQLKAEWTKVHDVNYYKHVKAGRLPTMRVEYRCGFAIYKEWIQIQNERGRLWWYKRERTFDLPENIDEALARCNNLKIPQKILVKKEGKYTNIKGHEF